MDDNPIHFAYDELLTIRERRLLENCRQYRAAPGGLPGHALMILIAKLDILAEALAGELEGIGGAVDVARATIEGQ